MTREALTVPRVAAVGLALSAALAVLALDGRSVPAPRTVELRAQGPVVRRTAAPVPLQGFAGQDADAPSRLPRGPAPPDAPSQGGGRRLEAAIGALAASLRREPFDLHGWQVEAAAMARVLGAGARQELGRRLGLPDAPADAPPDAPAHVSPHGSVEELIAMAELLRVLVGPAGEPMLLPPGAEQRFDALLQDANSPAHLLSALSAPHAALGSLAARRFWLTELLQEDARRASRACRALAAVRDAPTAVELARLLEHEGPPEVVERAVIVLGQWLWRRAPSLHDGPPAPLTVGPAGEWIRAGLAALAEGDRATPSLKLRASNVLRAWEEASAHPPAAL